MTQVFEYLSNLNFFSLFFVYNSMFLFSLYAAGIVLARNYKLSLKGVMYILFTCLFSGFLFTLPTFFRFNYEPLNPAVVTALHYLHRVDNAAFLFVYFYKIMSYTAKKAIILAIFSDLIRFAAIMPITIIFNMFFDLPPLFHTPHASLFMAYRLSVIILAMFFAFIVAKATAKLRKKINDSSAMQTVLMTGALIVWLTYNILHFFMPRTGGIDMSFTTNILIFGYTGTAVVSFLFYSKFMGEKLKFQQKEAEERSLRFYMNEIEQQQTALRKFKHDQQNLFATMDIFLQEKDWSGLTQFYSKVREASTIITENEVTLGGLSKIKVREIKNILLAKLAMAQNLEISTKFEAGGEIEDIPVDSVTLVRMLGIVLDNAIEELQSLGAGQLFVSCFKSGESTYFVVQNTCRHDILPIRQLRGSSTKGSGRGLGLNNLHELAGSLPNVALLTDARDGNFTQTLIIGG